MSPLAAVAVLVSITVLLAALGHPALSVAPGLAAALLAVSIFRIVMRRRRRAREDINAARARGAIGKAVATAHAMRDGLMTAASVIRTVQPARADIAHAGAPEARNLLDELEAEARAHPEGIPGSVVAAARMRFDQIMRANLQ